MNYIIVTISVGVQWIWSALFWHGNKKKKLQKKLDGIIDGIIV